MSGDPGPGQAPHESTPRESIPDAVARLGLEPIPDEGAWFAPGPRAGALSCITAALTGDPWGFSAMHRLTIDEGWQWVAGDPAEILLLGAAVEPGLRPFDADHPQVAVPAGTWMGARTLGQLTQFACWCTPPFEPEHFELGERAALVAAFPDLEAAIVALTRAPR